MEQSKCFICKEGKFKCFFVKKRGNIQESFERCTNCGLVINRTLYDMPREKWEVINYLFHSSYQGTDENSIDPKWLSRLKAQASVLADLFAMDIFSTGMRTIDYGCGDGKLSKYTGDIYEKKTGNRLVYNLIGKYDRYMALENEGYYMDKDIMPHSFDVVISCSVLEHLIGIKEIEEFFALAKDDGTICLHTLICQEVPNDPEWFYLTPHGHCTIWTNTAMKKIYTKYGYIGCAYNLESQMWFFFKDENRFKRLKDVKNKIYGSWFFSENFVDYWKQSPYRK